MLVGGESMQAAVKEACEMNDGSRDLCVSLDGTWQKRGHTSFQWNCECCQCRYRENNKLRSTFKILHMSRKIEKCPRC